jgi:hypothetical protein
VYASCSFRHALAYPAGALRIGITAERCGAPPYAGACALAHIGESDVHFLCIFSAAFQASVEASDGGGCEVFCPYGGEVVLVLCYWGGDRHLREEEKRAEGGRAEDRLEW